MTLIDIILILIIVLTIALGYRKGFIKQLASVVPIIVAIIACRLFGSFITSLILRTHPEWDYDILKHYSVSIFVNCAIYVAVYYGGWFICRMIGAFAYKLKLGFFDRIAGAAFTLVKNLLILSLLLNLYLAVFPSGLTVAESGQRGGKVTESVINFAPAVLDTFSPVEAAK